jgi:hypothetical protein
VYRWRKRLGATEAFVIITLAVVAFGCSGSNEPREFSDRQRLPSCGSVDLRDGLTGEEDASAACLWEAHAADRPGELTIKVRSTEGALVLRYARTLAGVAEMFYDDHRDPYRGSDWSYQGGCLSLQPSALAVVSVDDCKVAIELS